MADELAFDDVELTYEIAGHGERVVLVHAAPFVSWYRPLVERLPFFSVLHYRRRLRRDGGGPLRPLTVAEDAAICARLMDHVGWPTAHVAGHSYGALVALGLASDAPERASSIALLEPAARGISSAAQVVAALQPVFAAYRAGDKAGAMDGFLRTVGGDDYRSELDRLLPDAFDDAVAQADIFFQSEMAAVQAFDFGPEKAQTIPQPVLNVLGTESVRRFVEGAELVQSWFPRAERFSLPAAGHLLMVQNPAAMAQGLTDFFSRHPITEAQAIEPVVS
jgi:pimeloyl-ACP methyl ester carboxylesterase